jgi:hypothetical protein
MLSGSGGGGSRHLVGWGVRRLDHFLPPSFGVLIKCCSEPRNLHDGIWRDRIVDT